MVKVNQYKRAIDLYYEDVGGEDRSKTDLPLESVRLFDWLGENPGAVATLDVLLNREFPNGADRTEYHYFFRDKWEKIAKETGCPKEELES